jgi:hypothetical protein
MEFTMRNLTPRFRALALTGGLLALGGCQTLTSKQSLDSYNQRFAGGHYRAAAEFALESGGIDPQGKSNDLLWSLQAGVALNASGEFAFSTRVFDQAEQLMKAEDTESIGRKGVERVTAALVNDNLNRYSPTVMDGVMVNTYKALNNIFLQDLQNARIEFNRAADRQRRAEETFKTRIAEQQEKMAALEQQAPPDGGQATMIDLAKSRQASENAIFENFPELKQWQAYPDFVNPYTDYLHGLYFMLANADREDYGKARHSLRRVAGMTTANAAVKTDLMVIDNLRRGRWHKQRLRPAVWVIFENGAAPSVDEIVIRLPLFLLNDQVKYSQIALPKLRLRDQAYPYLEIYAGGRSRGKTELLASMDRVIQTEFKREFPLKVTEALASTLSKAYLQYQAQEKAGDVGDLLAGLYQATTTRADTRSWTSLPKEVQVARLRRPADGKLQLRAPGLATPLQIDLPDNQFTLIHVRATAPGSVPVYQIAGFDA